MKSSGASSPPIRVWIVEDDPDARFALLSLAESVRLGARAFSSAEELLEAYRPEHRGCVVSDHRLSGMSGLELFEELTRRGSRLPFLIISGQADVPTAVAAIQRGVFDFLQKPIVLQEALERIQAAIRAEAESRAERDRDAESSQTLESLTERESEVLERLIAGKKNREIAAELGISERTVEIHRSRVMEKTGAGSLAELARRILSQQSRT